MLQDYADVQVSDVQYVYNLHGDITVCDADKQQAEIESETYESLTTW